MQKLQAYLTGPRRIFAIILATVALLIAIIVTTGLFDSDGAPEEFTAQSFVDTANDEGAGLILGDPLINAQENVKVYGISFEASGSPAADAGKTADGEEHGGASLTVSPDSNSAVQVYQQCEATGTFRCYRANNVALVFDEGTDPHALAEVDSALRALAGS